MIATVIIIIIINLFTGGRTQKARPVQGAYCMFATVCICLSIFILLSMFIIKYGST